MKQLFYYYRGFSNNPMITVCILVENNVVLARGIAFCSLKDNFSKAKGKKIALNRAKAAYNLKKNVVSTVINNINVIYEIVENLNIENHEDGQLLVDISDCKSLYMPEELTKREVSILNKIKERNNDRR